MRLPIFAVMFLIGCLLPLGSVDDDDSIDKGLARSNLNNLMSDEFYRASDFIDAEAIQKFFENIPYDARSRGRANQPLGRRSWLADFKINDERASDAFARLGRQHNINPLILISRLQMESSLVAPTQEPSRSSRAAAFGCGCPDGRGCNPAYSGFVRQIDCAYLKHDETFKRSQGILRRYDWNMGVESTTRDHYTITPINHATAALYLYTPWAYGRGGSPSHCKGGACMIYNLTDLYLARLKFLGLVAEGVTPRDDVVDGSSISLTRSDENKLRGGAYFRWGELNVAWSSIENAAVRVDGHSVSPEYDRRGRWEIDIPSGPYTVTVNAPGFLEATETCQSGGSFCWVQLQKDPSAEEPTSSERGVGTACRTGPHSGSCIHTEIMQCGGGTLRRRLCPGANEVRCCLTESSRRGVGAECTSRDGTRSGACIDTEIHSCDGSMESERCPGPGSVRCCLR